eukprot:g58882.t1
MAAGIPGVNESVLCEGAEILAVTGTIRGSPLGVGPEVSCHWSTLATTVSSGWAASRPDGVQTCKQGPQVLHGFRAKLLYSYRVFDVEAIVARIFVYCRPGIERAGWLQESLELTCSLGDPSEGFDFNTLRTPTGSGNSE